MPDVTLTDPADCDSADAAPAPTRLPSKRVRRATKTVPPSPAPPDDAPSTQAPPPPQRASRRSPTAANHRTGPIPTREMYPIAEARQTLGGMSHSAFCERVREGLIPLIAIGRRRYVSAETIRRIVGA